MGDDRSSQLFEASTVAEKKTLHPPSDITEFEAQDSTMSTEQNFTEEEVGPDSTELPSLNPDLEIGLDLTEMNSAEADTESDKTGKNLVEAETELDKTEMNSAEAKTELDTTEKNLVEAETDLGSTEAISAEAETGVDLTEQTSAEAQVVCDSTVKNSAEAEIGLACPRCLLSFSDTRIPQMIPECQHVCCISCLIQLTKWDANSTLKCPRCEKTSKLPSGGTAAMGINEWLYKFVQQHHKGRLREHLDDITHDLHGMHEDVEKSIADLKELEKDTKAVIKTEEEQVDRCVEAVQAEAWVLKAQIRKIGEQRLRHLQEDIAQLESRARDIKTVHEITQGSQDNGNIQHIKYDELSSQMDKLLTATSPTTNSINSPQSARFLRENVTLGRVIKLNNLQLVYEFADRFKQVQDVVVTPNGLLGVCDSEGCAVTVYCKNELDNNNLSRYTKHISLELDTSSNPNQPTGMAATLDGKYVVARRTGVEFYSMTGAYLKTFRTTLTKTSKSKTKASETETNVYSLTTTDDGKILAGDINRCVITVHDLAGDIISTLPTPIKPRCLAPAWDKHLVAITDWESGRLCVQHIGSGSIVLTLNTPDVLGVCYDYGSASLLVSRCERDHKTGEICVGSGVIEQYNSSGDRTLIVCLAQDLYGAGAIEFIGNGNDMLAVADYKAVKIYRVT